MDVFVSTALVDIYAKCGCLYDALKVLDKMSQRNVVSWNTMVVGCAHNGCPAETLEFLRKM